MEKKAVPIKPEEVARLKENIFPNEVFEAFNELIAEKYSNGIATVMLKDVVSQMVAKGLDKKDIFGRGWIHVEEVYRLAGWKVKLDQPGYNESYESYFVFSK
jgi:hypothetical protein